MNKLNRSLVADLCRAEAEQILVRNEAARAAENLATQVARLYEAAQQLVPTGNAPVASAADALAYAEACQAVSAGREAEVAEGLAALYQYRAKELSAVGSEIAAVCQFIAAGEAAPVNAEAVEEFAVEFGADTGESSDDDV